MNTLTRMAASTVDFGWVLGGMTVLFLAFFLAWVYVAYAPKNKARWEEDAMMPFMDGGDS